MPEDRDLRCQSNREQLIELLVESRKPSLDGPVADHLAACPSCRAFWATLSGLQPALMLPDLYTPGLKYRTLDRLAAEAESPDRGFLSLMIPVSFLSLLFWFAIPLFLLTRLLDFWVSQPSLALMLSILSLTSVGFLVGCLAFVTLHRGNGAEQFKGRMKNLLEGFHA